LTIKNYAWLALGFTLILSGCGKGVEGGDAATVDGVPISRADYYSYLEQKAQMSVQTPQGVQSLQLAGSPAFQAMKDLIIDKIIEKIAKNEGVYPTDDDVKKEIDFEQVDNPNLLQQAIAKGYSVQMLQEEFRVELCKFKIITKGVTVTPDQVNQYIKDHSDTFMTPPQIESLMISVDSDEKKAAVNKELGSGKAFATVAAELSVDPNGRQNGYHYPVSDTTKMPDQLRAVFNQTAEQHTTPWIHASNGWVIFYINHKTPATPQPITDNLRERVRRSLMTQEGLSATDFEHNVQQELIKDKDLVHVDQKAAIDPWNQFAKEIETTPGVGSAASAGSQPAPSGAPATPPSTPPPIKH